MIKLLYPRSDQSYYVFVSPVLFGPIAKNGNIDLEEFSKQLLQDKMEEKDGIWGENDVEHTKFVGEVLYLPLLESQTPNFSPNPPYVNAISLRMKNSYDTIVNVVIAGGIATDNHSQLYYLTDYAVSHVAVRKISDNVWEMCNVQARVADPYTIRSYNLSRLVFSPHDGRTIQVKVKTTTESGQLYLKTKTNWLKHQTASTIFAQKPGTVRDLYDTRNVSVLRNISSPRYSPSYVVNKFAMLGRFDYLGLNNLEAIDFGELAMSASSKVIANHVNMIAFIKDLKDPKSLIPKLKNLRNLKTYGNNYLTYKYGVLPTISDLNEIRSALLRRLPYLDKNGFKTYNAAHVASDSFGRYTIELEQRIKLAIESEDNAFQGLIQSLESVGMFPTFENIWDLVPYSFVLDWFIDVGDMLERIDTRLRLIRLNIRYVTMSLRMATKLDIAEVGSPFVGWIGKVHYHRWVSDQCPVPSLYSQSKPESFGHWIEGGALLLQRIK